MTWTFAPYIPRADIADRPAGYVWNDKNPLFYYREDSRFEKRIGQICARGVLALSAGSAEWVAARWPRLAEPALLPEIEAMWAGIIDWRYMYPPVSSSIMPKGEDCQGPERGPICDAFLTLSNIIGRAQRSASTLAHCATLSQLAIHVLPDASGFKEWRRAVIERVTALYPRQKEDPIGPPIPREALDPNQQYQPEMAQELLARFLRGLDYRKNPLLRSPEDLRQQGFKGTPYALD